MFGIIFGAKIRHLDDNSKLSDIKCEEKSPGSHFDRLDYMYK